MIEYWWKNAEITWNDKLLAKKEEVLQEMIDYWWKNAEITWNDELLAKESKYYRKI